MLPPACPPAPHVEERVVSVDAYEHKTLGFVFAEPDLVVVHYDAIEVDRPGSVAAWLTDHRGVRHASTLVATSPAEDIAFLRADAPLTEAPLVARPAALGAPTCTYSVEGVPTLDEDGRIVTAGAFDALRTARSSSPTRRSWIFYGAGSMHFSVDTMSHAVGALGGSAGIAARYRDLLELRLDASLTFLVRPRGKDEKDECGEPPCFAGMRTTLTPSVGPRIRLGGSRAESIAVTPSVGFAMVAQLLQDPKLSPAPATQALFAPGLAVSYSVAELGVRVLVPRGAVTDPAVEMSIGFVF